MTGTGGSLLLVGGSSDIGRELLRKLDGLDLPVFAHCNRSASKLNALASELRTLEIRVVQADVTRDAEVARMLQEVRSTGPMPDRLVFLAAPKFQLRRHRDVTWSDFQREIGVQIEPTVAILKELLPDMAREGRGKIVFVLSSVTQGVPPVGLSPYVTVKHALLGLMRSLAAEYATKRININAVSPSMTETAFLEELPERLVEITGQQSPWRRNATPQDVAGAIRFLLSPEADYVTGVNLLVSGGSAF